MFNNAPFYGGGGVRGGRGGRGGGSFLRSSKLRSCRMETSEKSLGGKEFLNKKSWHAGGADKLARIFGSAEDDVDRARKVRDRSRSRERDLKRRRKDERGGDDHKEQ